MPGFNGTGPLGKGPGTGRGRGACMAGSGLGIGRMAGRGRGLGLGRQGVFAQDAGDAQADRIAALEAEIADLKNKLAQSGR